MTDKNGQTKAGATELSEDDLGIVQAGTTGLTRKSEAKKIIREVVPGGFRQTFPPHID